MKTSYKKFFSITLLLFLVTLFACQQDKYRCSDSCCGETFKERFVKVNSMSISTGSLKTIKGDGYEVQEFSNDTSTNYETAAIEIKVSDIEYLDMTHQLPSKNEFDFSLINKAIACSPPAPTPTQKLISINIISDDTVKTEGKIFKPNEDLSELFSVNEEIVDPISIEEFIKQQQEQPYLFRDYGVSIFFRLYEELEIENQTITITLKTDTQEEFVLTTDEFIVN